MAIGLKFATASGLVLKVGQYQDKDDVMKFECALFSCYPEERETLFFGGDTVLRIKGILQWADGKWRHYDKYMEPINAFCRMMNGLSVKQQLITTKKSSQKTMKIMICDVLRSLIWEQHDVKTPKYVQNLVRYHLLSVSNVRLLYEELITDYQWLHCILKTDGARINTETDSESDSDSESQEIEGAENLNIVNIAVLFCHCDDITFIMTEGAQFTEPQCSFLIKDIVSISEMSLDINVRFMWPSSVPEPVKSQISEASIAFYGTDCQRRFDGNSVLFTISESLYNADTLKKFRSQVAVMRKQLMRVPLQKTKIEKSKSSEDSNITDSIDFEVQMKQVMDLNYFSDAASINQTSGRKRAIIMLISGFVRRLKKEMKRNYIIPSSTMDLLFRFIYDQSVSNYYEPKRKKRKKTKKKKVNVFMPGLDAAGTTTILYRLKTGEIITTTPTIGFNVETIDYKGKEITIWDLRGCSKVRPMWNHYYDV